MNITEIRKMLSDGMLTLNAPIGDFLQSCEYVSNMDKKNEFLKKLYMFLFIIFLVITIIFIFVLHIYFLAIVPGIATVVTFVVQSFYAKINICDDFRNYYVPLIEDIQADLKPKSNVAVNFNTPLLEKKEYITRRNKPYTKGLYKVNEVFYSREMFTSRLSLFDGNILTLSLKETLWKQTKSKPKKTKVKYKKKVSVQIRIRVNPATYSFNSKLEDNICIFKNRAITQKQTPKGAALIYKFSEKRGEKYIPDYNRTVEGVALVYSYLQSKATNQQSKES